MNWCVRSRRRPLARRGVADTRPSFGRTGAGCENEALKNDPADAIKDRPTAANHGVITSVRGSVVDVRFDNRLPPIYSLLRTGKEAQVAIEVLMQLDVHHVRGIALNPTQGLARGMAVEDTGGPLKVPVGKGILSRMFDVFGNPIDRQPAPSDVEWRTIHRDPPPLASRSSKSEVFWKPVSRPLTFLCRSSRGGKAGLFWKRGRW